MKVVKSIVYFVLFIVNFILKINLLNELCSFQTSLLDKIGLVNPDSENFALEIEDDSRHVDSDVDRSDCHEDNYKAISRDPVVNDPGPNPSDRGLEARYSDHEFSRKLN